MTDPVYRRQLLTDLRDLLEIVDRRLVHLRERGTPEALRLMEDIRAQMAQLLESVTPETEPNQN